MRQRPLQFLLTRSRLARSVYPAESISRFGPTRTFCRAGPNEVSVITERNLTHFLAYWYPPEGNTPKAGRRLNASAAEPGRWASALRQWGRSRAAGRPGAKSAWPTGSAAGPGGLSRRDRVL